jgi:hypothetical protein
MGKHLLVVTLIVLNFLDLGTAFGQQPGHPAKNSVIVAFYDEERLKNLVDGQTTLENFEYFLKPIQEIARRDFPDVEFTVLKQGGLLRLPDGTNLNVSNVQPALGFVLSARGRKRRILSGPQSEADFACAAAAFYRRSSRACSK